MAPQEGFSLQGGGFGEAPVGPETLQGWGVKGWRPLQKRELP